MKNLSRQVIVHMIVHDFTFFGEFVLQLLTVNMTTTSNLKSMFEIKRFEGSGSYLWRENVSHSLS